MHTEDDTYGAPRITAELNDGRPGAERVNHKRVARVMRAAGIAGYRRRRRVQHHRRPIRPTRRYPICSSVTSPPPTPNTQYVGDITYLPLATGGNLYLATVIDCCSRRVAGGRSPITCAPNWSSTPSEPPTRCGAHWSVPCSTPITEVSTPQRTSRSSAREFGVTQSMGAVGPVPTTRWPNRSTPTLKRETLQGRSTLA